MILRKLLISIALASIVGCTGTATDEVAPEKNDTTASETTTDETLVDDETADVTDTIDGETDDTEVDPSDDTTDTNDDSTDNPTDDTTDAIDDETDETEVTEDPCEDGYGPTCKGSTWPEWALEDFQPNSSRFEQSYGLNQFEGSVTLMSLHAAWCSYCRTQAMYLDQMLKELRAEGYDVEFVTVNKINAAEEGYQRSMVYMLSDENEIQYGDDGEPLYR